MNMQRLEQTAGELSQPSKEAADAFEQHREALAEELNRRMAARPDLEKLVGAGNLQMMEDNSRNFCRFMSTMFQGYEPSVMANTAVWVFRAYRAHGFHTTYWPANLDTFVEILKEKLPEVSYQELYPFFEWLIVSIPVLVKISDENPGDDMPTPSHGPAGEE